MPKRNRDYVAERLREKPERKRKRAARNRARLLMIKKHGKKAVAGKDVDHRDRNALNNSQSNLRIRNRKENQGDNK